ncbi:hypothetical protein [Streptomyces cavernicola]|uniref:Uncharacterized protein n=1 Tax=Streptomyces cavernicola TaxID=3043613 RepID=A0ABT6SCA3_9ACTN|nr:hypothetical protein [Streptomyces sp. B-S-A6]MDI3405823.1 hypothetical protein [Streptomyces sp. B-S-A6]
MSLADATAQHRNPPSPTFVRQLRSAAAPMAADTAATCAGAV